MCKSTTEMTTKTAHNLTHERQLCTTNAQPSTWYTQFLMTIKHSEDAVVVVGPPSRKRFLRLAIRHSLYQVCWDAHAWLPKEWLSVTPPLNYYNFGRGAFFRGSAASRSDLRPWACCLFSSGRGLPLTSVHVLVSRAEGEAYISSHLSCTKFVCLALVTSPVFSAILEVTTPSDVEHINKTKQRTIRTLVPAMRLSGTGFVAQL